MDRGREGGAMARELDYACVHPPRLATPEGADAYLISHMTLRLSRFE